MDWQPISTAPKDGNAILVTCEWDTVSAVCKWREDQWQVSWDHSNFEDGYEATHWMPLPPPPASDPTP